MARKLIVCLDGTWNDPNTNTNVYRLKNRIRPRDQLVYYDTGVGTGRVRGKRQTWLKNQLDRIGGGAFGSGLSGNVQEAYRWLAEHYQEDDELWFFGFSRGAFTARSLVGLIRNAGLLHPPFDDEVLRDAYDLYRKRDDGPDTPDALRFRARENSIPIDRLNIAFLGVWDTVGALGVPGRVFGRLARRRWGFHDTKLSRYVRRAYQALAADELRSAYLASLWFVQPPDEGPGDYPHQEVEQVWFPGTHSDVGGAAGEAALLWMAVKAEAAGLNLEPVPNAWPPPGPAPVRLGELQSVRWRLVCGRATRAIGDPHYANQSLAPVLRTLYDSRPDYRRENLVRFLDGHPLTAPLGRRWWYTLPGALPYYLAQYVEVKRRNMEGPAPAAFSPGH